MPTHIEIVSLDNKRFLFRKDMIISVTIGSTPKWVLEKYDYVGKEIAIINIDEKDDDGNLQAMMVKNSFHNLKKALV